MPSTALSAPPRDPKVRSSAWVSIAAIASRAYLRKQPFAAQPRPRSRVEWSVMRRFSAAAAASMALAIVPGSASAKVIEIGQTPAAMVPACPAKPCLAVSRTTGYQAKVGTNRGLMTAPANGRIVAWTVVLSKPSKPQINFFTRNYGGAAQAGLTVLTVGKHLRDTVKA